LLYAVRRTPVQVTNYCRNCPEFPSQRVGTLLRYRRGTGFLAGSGLPLPGSSTGILPLPSSLDSLFTICSDTQRTHSDLVHWRPVT
jgi:hypothetical protein